MAKIVIWQSSTGMNKMLAEKFAAQIEQAGHEYDIVDLVGLDLPLFTPAGKKAGGPQQLPDLIKRFDDCDAWIVCAPEYNGATPPVLSNLIAWLSIVGDDFRAVFNQRPVAISTFSGGGGAHVNVVMRQQFGFLGCNVLGRELLSNFSKEPNPDTIKAIVDELCN